MCGSRKPPCPHQVIENVKGRGASKPKVLKKNTVHEPKLEFPEGWSNHASEIILTGEQFFQCPALIETATETETTKLHFGVNFHPLLCMYYKHLALVFCSPDIIGIGGKPR